MLKKIAIISLFLFLPHFVFGATNRLENGLEEWKAEQAKKNTATQPSKSDQDNGQPILYKNDEHKFNLVVPFDWEQADNSQLNEKIDQISNEQGRNIQFEAGFRLKNQGNIGYPSILIRWISLDTSKVSHQQILDMFSKYSAEYLKASIDKQVNSDISSTVDIKSTQQHYDSQRKAVFIETDQETKNIGEIKSTIVMFLGKNGVTQVSFSSLKSDYPKYKTSFDSVIDSFSYDSGYEYNENHSVMNTTTSGVIMVLLVVFAISVLPISRLINRWRMKKNNPEKYALKFIKKQEEPVGARNFGVLLIFLSLGYTIGTMSLDDLYIKLGFFLFGLALLLPLNKNLSDIKLFNRFFRKNKEDKPAQKDREEVTNSTCECGNVLNRQARFCNNCGKKIMVSDN
jgi:hypothetical protein